MRRRINSMYPSKYRMLNRSVSFATTTLCQMSQADTAHGQIKFRNWVYQYYRFYSVKIVYWFSLNKLAINAEMVRQTVSATNLYKKLARLTYLYLRKCVFVYKFLDRVSEVLRSEVLYFISLKMNFWVLLMSTEINRKQNKPSFCVSSLSDRRLKHLRHSPLSVPLPSHSWCCLLIRDAASAADDDDDVASYYCYQNSMNQLSTGCDRCPPSYLWSFAVEVSLLWFEVRSVPHPAACSQ